MIDSNSFRKLALSLPHTEEVVHFDRAGFKVIGRRMFASYLAKDNTANIFLNPSEQKLFCRIDKRSIYPLPNKWGQKGVTTFVLDSVEMEVVTEALQSAYNDVISTTKK